jgi:hypothetical protein
MISLDKDAMVVYLFALHTVVEGMDAAFAMDRPSACWLDSRLAN